MIQQRILLIQSAQTWGNSTRHYLEERGYDVILVGSGLRALTIAKSTIVDLILLDLALPDTDGLYLCRLFWQHAETHSIPIILLTARGYKPERMSATGFGPVEYLAKPFTNGELDERIVAVLASRAAAKIIADAARISPPKPGLPIDRDSREELNSPREAKPGPILVTKQVPEQDLHSAPVAEAKSPQRAGPMPSPLPVSESKSEKTSAPSSGPLPPAKPAEFPEPDASQFSPILPFKSVGDAVVDPATGLFGRPQFEAMFSKEFKRAARFMQPMSIMLIDLNGQQRGQRADEALVKAIIGLVQQTIRDVDTTAWWSGEAFILLLPNTICHDALQAAARILESVAIYPFTWPDATRITMNIGVAGLPDSHIDTELKLIEAANTACQRAKELMVPPLNGRILKR